MKFSIITASRLIDYPSSARNKEQKLLRAINSVVLQTFTDWELLIIADGCLKTIEIVTDHNEDDRVKIMKVDHNRLWSGTPRNKGIDNAKGEYLIYLDIDDIYGENHLQTIAEGLKDFDWVWYNDIRYNPRIKEWFENQCDIRTLGKHGTSNICHKKLDVHWDIDGAYAHDYKFVKKLLQFKNHTKIRTPEYFVCHLPGGYDL